MEKMSIHDLGLFMDSEIYVLPEEISKLTSTEQTSGALVSENSMEEEKEILRLGYEGGYEKGILVIYEGQSLDGSLAEYLFKILGAVNCSLKDIALANATNTEMTGMEAISNMNPNKVIIFGKVRHEIMMSVRKTYEVHQGDGIEYLFADDLKQISESLELRKALWRELQVLFNITKK